jgi:hypothetical protein
MVIAMVRGGLRVPVFAVRVMRQCLLTALMLLPLASATGAIPRASPIPLLFPELDFVASDGTVNGVNYFTQHGILLAAPMVDIVATPDQQGYWLVGSDGGVFAFGDAQFFGSLSGVALQAAIVGMARTPDGKGYWLVGSDGGVFAFGDAQYLGSAADQQLNAPVISIAPTNSGHGYWLAAADGGVFAYGDASFMGSMAGHSLDAPVIGIAATDDSGGYWLDGFDGGIFAFGDAPFYGASPHLPGWNVGPVLPAPEDRGYWMAGYMTEGWGDAASLGDEVLYSGAGAALAACSQDGVCPIPGVAVALLGATTTWMPAPPPPPPITQLLPNPTTT